MPLHLSPHSNPLKTGSAGDSKLVLYHHNDLIRVSYIPEECPLKSKVAGLSLLLNQNPGKLPEYTLLDPSILIFPRWFAFLSYKRGWFKNLSIFFQGVRLGSAETG